MPGGCYPGIYLLPNAGIWLAFCWEFETYQELASQIANAKGAVAITDEQPFHGAGDSALDRRRSLQAGWPVWRGGCERR